MDLILTIEKLSLKISLYLLSDKRSYEDEAKQLAEKLKTEFTLLRKNIRHDKFIDNKEDMLLDWNILEKKITYLFKLSNDPVRRYPGIVGAGQKLYPINVHFDSLVELMLIDLEGEEQIKSIITLKDALHNLRYSWSRYISSFRLFMATRTKEDRNNMKNYKAVVEGKFNIFQKTFKQGPDFLDFHNDSIKDMRNTLNEFNSHIDDVIKLFNNDTWRSDINYLNTEIEPLFFHLKDDLNKFINTEISIANLHSNDLLDSNSTQRSFLYSFTISILFFGAYLAFVFSRHITDRLQILMAATYKATAGNLDVDFKLSGDDELTQLGHNFIIMTKTIKLKSRELEAQKVALDQHDIVSIADPAGLITYVNNKFCEVSGYKSSELIGRYHNVVNSGAHDKEFWKDMWRTIGRGRVWHGEVRNKKKDGSYYWVNTTIVPFLNENNKPYQYVSMRTDITAMKQSQTDLLKLNDDLERRVEERTEAVETAMRGMEHALKDVDREKKAIQAIVSGTTTASGESFYQSLVKNASEALDMEYAILATYSNTEMSKCHVKSMWAIDRPGDNFDYDLIGTPCEHVAGREKLIVEKNVAQKFPKDALLKELEVESYNGIPMFDSKGKPLGHLLAMGKKPVTNSSHHQKLLSIFATRAATELERENINELLELRLEQQASSAQLGQLALAGYKIDDLFVNVVNVIQSSLNVEFAKILKYRRQSDDFLLIAGVGWEDGIVGETVVENNTNSQAGFTLKHEDIVIVNNFSTETRFNPPALLTNHHVKSGMSTVIADTKGLFGIISVHSKELRVFNEDDARFLNSVSQILTMAITRLEAEMAVEHELQVQHIISELLQLSLLDAPLREQLSNALNIILTMKTFDIDSKGCIFLFDDHKNTLKLMANQGFSQSTLENYNEIPLKQLFREKDARKQAMVINDSEINELKINFTSELNYYEYIIQIKVGNKLIGVLNLYVTHSNNRNRQQDEFLFTAANTLAGIIERKYAEQALVDAYRHKSEFLSSMSHELRTPLNSIIGFSKTMLKGIDGPINDEQNISLSHIHKSGQHLLSLIGDILDMSKLEANKMDLHYSEVDMTQLLDDIVRTIQVQTNEKGLIVNIDIEKNLALIPCDETRIKQVLLNIASNAVKFTEKGGIEFYCHLLTNENEGLPDIVVERIANIDCPFLLITTKDTGIGITDEDKPKIFEEFGQIDNSSTRKHTGTGLGMTISKRLVEMHGGEMWFESSVGKGSTFNFIIPMRQPC